MRGRLCLYSVYQIFILYFKYLFYISNIYFLVSNIYYVFLFNSSYMVNSYSVLSNICSVFQYLFYMANTFYFHNPFYFLSIYSTLLNIYSMLQCIFFISAGILYIFDIFMFWQQNMFLLSGKYLAFSLKYSCDIDTELPTIR